MANLLSRENEQELCSFPGFQAKHSIQLFTVYYVVHEGQAHDKASCGILIPSFHSLRQARGPYDTPFGNQAFQNGRCHICFSLGLDNVETGYNLLME